MTNHYQVVVEESIKDLEETVSKLILEGWRPQGGIAIIRFDYEDRKGYSEAAWFYHQAMTFRDPMIGV